MAIRTNRRANVSTRGRGGLIAAATGLALALTIATPGSGAAQAQGIGLKVNAGFTNPGGDLGDDVGLDSGLGFEATLSRAWASGLEIGIGTGISFHDLNAIDDDADLITVYAEPIYRLRARATRAPHLHPFFGGRVGYARLGHPIDDLSRNGFMVGPIGGLEYWLSDEVGIVGTASFDFFDFGENDAGGADVGGNRFGIHGGLKVRFD